MKEPDSAQNDDIPTFKQLMRIRGIAALLKFDPVPRSVKRKDGWTPDLQREFVARLAFTGSANQAAQHMGKNISGIEAIYRDRRAASFRNAWDRALEAGTKRAAEREANQAFAGRAPGVSVRGPTRLTGEYDAEGRLRQPGQMRNHLGVWEDEEEIWRQHDEAKDRISRKMLSARRLLLKEIADSPGKRAAWEILTELPVDWDKARRCEEQADEPFHKPPRMKDAHMILTCESGWLGEMVHGPDRKSELQQALNEHLISEGKAPIDWANEPDD